MTDDPGTNQPMIIMPTQQQLQYYTENVEKLLHETDGWNRPAGLFTICIEDQSTLSIFEVPLDLGDEPVFGLYSVAVGLSQKDDPDAEKLRNSLASENTIGFVLSYEKAGEIAELPGGLRRHPSGQKSDARTRITFGMDILGRIYYLTRTRGQNPVALTDLSGVLLSGMLPTAMRTLNIVLAERTDDPPRFLSALADVEILTREEADDYVRKHGRGHVDEFRT